MKDNSEWLIRRPLVFAVVLFFGGMAMSEFWHLILFKGAPHSWEDALSAGVGTMVGGLLAGYWLMPKIRRTRS